MLVGLSCPGDGARTQSDLLSSCQTHLETECLHQVRLQCFSSCPPGLSLSASTASLHSQTWQVDFRDNLSSSLEVYLDTVNILNQVSPGSRVRVASTLVTDDTETEVETEVGRRRRRSSEYLRRLMVSVCGCLAWQHNYRQLQPSCVGQINTNCSQSVSRTWWSLGADRETDCTTVVQLVARLLRVRLDHQEVCHQGDQGDQGDQGTSLTYHLTPACSHHTGSGAPTTLTIIKDHQASRTYIRVSHQSWLSLAATFGGLWSLLTGISVLSVLELAYWAISHLSTSNNHRNGFTDNRL